MTTNQTIDGVQAEQMACMPVDRSYDVRAKMIIAFNEAKKAGGDLDDALDAAYKSALRYSPNPMSAEQPAAVAVDEMAEFTKWTHEVIAESRIGGLTLKVQRMQHLTPGEEKSAHDAWMARAAMSAKTR